MKRLLLVGCLLGLLDVSAEGAEPAVRFEAWSDSLFARASEEHRFILLDLGAAWCHWCHVMESTTYRDAAVARLVGERFIAVRADQDADPDLSRRYEDYGWPATIVFSPDGKELVKRRGYLPPAAMASLLQAIVDDPTPGPSVQPDRPWVASARTRLGASARAQLERRFVAAFDRRWAGWGSIHKFLDAEPIEYALSTPRHQSMARRTLDAALQLIDPIWGGIYQYSDSIDWKSPHFEKIMAMQTGAIEMYALAYRRWHEPRHLAAAQAIARYLGERLTDDNGALYTSQDADVDEHTTGKIYYALDDAARRKAGTPHIDEHQYPRENGWAIRAYAALYSAALDPQLVERARRAADWIETHRLLPDGAYRHGEDDRAGPYLGDTLAMAEAEVRWAELDPSGPWLARARRSARAIEARFSDGDGGFVTAPAARDAGGVFAVAARVVEENVAVARLAARLGRLTHDPRDRALGAHAMRYLSSPTLFEARPFSPAALLADCELSPR